MNKEMKGGQNKRRDKCEARRGLLEKKGLVEWEGNDRGQWW